jgi:tetratricopeptide (TPR) repeat protein
VERKLIDARTALGLYYTQIFLWIEAKEAVEPVVELALQLDYKRRISQIYTITGAYHFWVKEDFPRALRYLEDALKLAEELNDTLSLFMANFRLGEVLGFCCGFERALYHLGKALEINVTANSLYGIAIIKSFITLFVHNPRGKLDLGYQTSGEAMRIAEESGDPYSKGWAYFAHGESCHFKGSLKEAEEHSLRVTDIEVGERVTLTHWGYGLLGNIYLDRGEYQKSQDCFKKAISIVEDYNIDRHKDFMATGLLNRYRIALARVKAITNEKHIDLNEIFKCYQENKLKIYEGEMTRYVGEMLLDIDDRHMNEAEDWINKAVDVDKRNGTMWNLGRDYTAYAELFKRKGDHSKAKEHLSKAIEILKECGADGWVQKYEKELASLS